MKPSGSVLRCIVLVGVGLTWLGCGTSDPSAPASGLGTAANSGDAASGSASGSGPTSGGTTGSLSGEISGSASGGTLGSSGSATNGSTSGNTTGLTAGSTSGTAAGSGGGSSDVTASGGASGDTEAGSTDDGAAPANDAGADEASTPTTDAGLGGFNPCPTTGPCVIMPLGDSITYGYIPNENPAVGGGYRMELFALALADNHAITFVGPNKSGPSTVNGRPFPQGNAGYSGYTIDSASPGNGAVQPLVPNDLATYKPNIILLMVGTNDMHYAIDLPNAPKRLGVLIDLITSDKPDALVVVAQIPDAKGAQSAPTATYNAAIPAVVQARVAQGKHLLLVDMHTALGPWGTAGASANFGDSEHPSAAGYTIMAHTWYPAISRFFH